MKVIVTTYKKPLHWDVTPDEETVYDLKNEMERRFFIRYLTNIDSDEYMTLEEYNEKEKEGL